MNQAALTSATLRVQAEQIADAYVPAYTGRPSLIQHPDTLQLLLAAIADGSSREDAAREAGIAPRTLFNWLKKAEHGDEAAQAFVQSLEKEEAKVKRRCTRNVIQAGDDPRFWAASMTYLERKDPEHWGRRNEDSGSPKVVVQIGGNVTDVKLAVVTPSPVPRNDLDPLSTGQVEMLSPINSDYVNQPADRVSEPAAQPDSGPAHGLRPHGPSGGDHPADGGVVAKASGRGRKKKGR